MPLLTFIATIQITLASSKDLNVIPALWNQASIEQEHKRVTEANNIFKVVETLIDKSSSPNKKCLKRINQKLKLQQEVTFSCGSQVAMQP